MNTEALQLVRKYTDASMSDCLAALRETDGDTLEATKSLLTPQKISELRNNLISRIIVPSNINGPPSPDEAQLMLYIQESCQQEHPG